MRLVVNDGAVEVDDALTVAALLARLGFPDRGIAVAVDQTVVPRSRWHIELTEGAKIDVVTAVQGG